MDADRLAEIKVRVLTETGRRLDEMHMDAIDLLAEVERLQAERVKLSKMLNATIDSSQEEIRRLQAENGLLRAALHAWVEAGEKRLSGFRGASVPIMDEDRATSARIEAARRILRADGR